MRQPPHLPRDLLEEVELELREAVAQLSGDRRRLAALEELKLVCRQVGDELGRPVTVFDVIRTATSDLERRRRRDLVRALRSPGT